MTHADPPPPQPDPKPHPMPSPNPDAPDNAVALPVINAPPPAAHEATAHGPGDEWNPPKGIRKSRMSRKRAAVLTAVHLLIIAHATHYLIAGRSLTPVEPSEAMYTLELGQINAGAIFFALALISTLVFGRFFCGWGCHLVAYQDLCGWFMRKLGIKPVAFRSRLLMLVPFGLAFYMFVWPAIKRALFHWSAFQGLLDRLPVWGGFLFGTTKPAPFPGFSNHLVTDAFWKTFPGPFFAVVSIAVCGFAIVYFLGAKAFCTYGCPYGAFFSRLDRLALGRIRVTDACAQCGHCTATCTSNVRVNVEVKRYGMVVDPGCMKCMDCISVCPNDALYFSLTPRTAPGAAGNSPVTADPSAESKAPTTRARFDTTLLEDLILLAVCLIATLSFRGLYDGPPLLLSVGLGAVTALITAKTWRLLRDPSVRLQRTRLKSASRWTRQGILFVALAAVWLGFVAHSGFVQWHRAWGRHHLELTEAGYEIVSPNPPRRSYSPLHDRAVEQAFRHFTLADRWGLFDVPDIKNGLAWLYLCKGQPDQALALLQNALDAQPDNPAAFANLVDILWRLGKTDRAIEITETWFARHTPRFQDRFAYAARLERINRREKAIDQYRLCTETDPDRPEAWYKLGMLLGRAGRFTQAVNALQQARNLAPENIDTHIELAIALAGAGRIDDAIRTLQTAARIDPDDPRPNQYLQNLRANLSNPPNR